MSDLKKNSNAITTGPNRAPARSMLKAVGFTDEDLRKPIVGVASTWIEIGPCNYHLRRLSQKVKEGIRAAGGTPMEFNTVSISDGITMGAEGMKASLISREVIADSIELEARGNHFDAIVCLSGCDKTNPGVVMALARLDIPGLALYGGSIAPGHLSGRDLTIITYGAVVQKALQAAVQMEKNDPGLSIEVIDLRSLAPYDWDAIRDSVEKTSRVLIAHEDTLSWGYGAEIAARIAGELFDRLDAPVGRVAALDTWVGYNPQLENEILPQVEDIAREAQRLLKY